jgi:glycosyltransferase involved in cell wall biosynthesis
MSTLAVTALINTYNYGRYVEEAIESVLAQDFPSREMQVIVVDDGSTDDTLARVKKFGHRIRYFYKSNGGQASALNLGFQQARGDIVALLDADDLWAPRKITRVVEAFQKHPEAGLVYHPLQFWDVQRNLHWNNQMFPGVSGFVPADPRHLLTYGDLSTSALAFRAATLRNLLPIPLTLSIYADGYLGYLIIFLGPVLAIDDALATYRLHGQNLASRADRSLEGLERRHACFASAVAEIKSWLRRRGYDLHQPDIAAYLKRYELVEQMLRFTLERPGRREFFQYLLANERLYRPLWTPGYRLFRSVLAWAALLLGYDLFESLRGAYRESGALRLRESILPAR